MIDVRKIDRRQLLHYRQTSGVPENFRWLGFDAFKARTEQERAARAACEQFLETFFEAVWDRQHVSLWILGPTGTGKTLLASALVTEHLFDSYEAEAEGDLAMLITPMQLIRRLRSTWRKDAKETEDQVIEALVRPELLVLDDLGAGWGSSGEQLQIAEVIDARYTRFRPTVITSNLDAEALRRELGDRAFDRLKHGARIVPLTGASHRKPLDEARVVTLARTLGG